MNAFAELYLLSSALLTVYSLLCSGVLDCTRAIHQDAAFYYLVQSDETEKGFWGWYMPHSFSTNSLFFETCTLHIIPL